MSSTPAKRIDADALRSKLANRLTSKPPSTAPAAPSSSSSVSISPSKKRSAEGMKEPPQKLARKGPSTHGAEAMEQDTRIDCIAKKLEEAQAMFKKLDAKWEAKWEDLSKTSAASVVEFQEVTDRIKKSLDDASKDFELTCNGLQLADQDTYADMESLGENLSSRIAGTEDRIEDNEKLYDTLKKDLVAQRAELDEITFRGNGLPENGCFDALQTRVDTLDTSIDDATNEYRELCGKASSEMTSIKDGLSTHIAETKLQIEAQEELCAALKKDLVAQRAELDILNAKVSLNEASATKVDPEKTFCRCEAEQASWADPEATRSLLENPSAYLSVNVVPSAAEKIKQCMWAALGLSEGSGNDGPTLMELIVMATHDVLAPLIKENVEKLVKVEIDKFLNTPE